MSRRDRTGMATGVLACTSLVGAINVSLLNLALADISEQLGASTATLQWVVNGYALAFAALLLTASTVGRWLGLRRAFRGSLVLFAAASLLGAWAPNSSVLIAIRVLMGCASGIMMPIGLSLLAHLNPDRSRRDRAFGRWMASASIGFIAGPIVAGLLLDRFWWGSVLLLNVPTALVLLVATVTVPEVAQPPASRIDLPGLVLSTAGIVVLVHTIIQAPTRGWGDPTTAIGSVVGVALLAVFVRWERRAPDPLLDLHLFRNRTVVAALAGGLVFNLVFSGALPVVSLALRTYLGYSPIRSGFALVPLALAMFVASLAAPRLCDRLGLQRAVTLGFALLGAGSLVFALLPLEPGYTAVAVATVLLGLAYGFASSPMTATVVGHEPSASGILVVGRQLGLTFGVAILGSALASRFVTDIGRAGDQLGLDRAEAAQASESMSGALRVAATLPRQAGATLTDAAGAAFVHGVRAAGVACVVISAVAAVAWLRWVPAEVGEAVAPVDEAVGPALDGAPA